MTFQDLNLIEPILRALKDEGYDTPTPIQQQSIPHSIMGTDLLACAQTGTGKTAAFAIPILQRLSEKYPNGTGSNHIKTLILTPTRELAIQIGDSFTAYGRHLKLRNFVVFGGVGQKPQEDAMRRGVDILIATPGRLLDLMNQGFVSLSQLEIFVLDEADRMLDMGFIPDIERIFSLTPFTRQTLFFSATMAPEIERITNTFLTAPARVEVARQATASETIDQHVVIIRPSRRDKADSEKRAVLRALIDAEGDACTNAIVFCNRKVDVDIVAKSLKKYGYDAAPIHGDLDQSQRTRTLDAFRAGELKILVASDVAARGLDVPSVSHVFNFDVPGHPEDYIHRIGRTGRAGRSGKALTICNPRDEKALAAVEGLIQREISRLPDPTAGTAAAFEADSETPPEQGTRPGTSRSRARGGPRKDAPPPAEKAAPAAKPRPQERIEERREPRRESRGPRRDDTGPRVVGMGDHLPGFIALSFEERRNC